MVKDDIVLSKFHFTDLKGSKLRSVVALASTNSTLDIFGQMKLNKGQMKCDEVLYSDHALSQMFKRDIEITVIRYIIEHGEAIDEYPNDRPYPSYLLLGFVQARPIHLVIAKDLENEKCIIITAYEPDHLIWEAGFKTKKK